MKKHTKKMIAPIVISAFIIAYFGVFFLITFIGLAFDIGLDSIPLVAKIIFSVVPAGAVGVTIYVLIQRINEIRSGEEDDLSKY